MRLGVMKAIVCFSQLFLHCIGVCERGAVPTSACHDSATLDMQVLSVLAGMVRVVVGNGRITARLMLTRQEGHQSWWCGRRQTGTTAGSRHNDTVQQQILSSRQATITLEVCRLYTGHVSRLLFWRDHPLNLTP
jgi:hypothetical protein